MQIAITGCGWVTPRGAGNIDTVLRAYAGNSVKARSASSYDPIPPEIFAPFTNLPGATSPYTNSITDAQQFFRLKGN